MTGEKKKVTQINAGDEQAKSFNFPERDRFKDEGRLCNHRSLSPFRAGSRLHD